MRRGRQFNWLRRYSLLPGVKTNALTLSLCCLGFAPSPLRGKVGMGGLLLIHCGMVRRGKSEAHSAGWILFKMKRCFKINFAGGSPAADYFSCLAKKSNQREKRPDSVSRSAGAGGALQLCPPTLIGALAAVPATGPSANGSQLPPVRRSFGLPCAARHAGRLRNSPLSKNDKGSDSARRLPPA